MKEKKLICKKCGQSYSFPTGACPNCYGYNKNKTKNCSRCKNDYPLTKEYFRLEGYRPASACRVCENKARKKRREKNPIKYKNQRYINLYGITYEDKKRMLGEQNGTCKICGKPISIESRRTHIDHDHKTNYIRGILCSSCNKGLGNFKDNTLILIKAVEYLTSIKVGNGILI